MLKIGWSFISMLCLVLYCCPLNDCLGDDPKEIDAIDSASGHTETIDPDICPLSYSLVHVVVENEITKTNCWLPVKGNQLTDVWEGSPLFRLPDCDQYLHLAFMKDKRVSIKMRKSHSSSDHTIYGYNYSPPKVGDMQPWASYKEKLGLYAIMEWKHVTGMTADADGDGRITALDCPYKEKPGIPNFRKRIKVRLDFGPLNFGILGFHAENDQGKPTGRVEIYSKPAGGAPLSASQLKFNLAATQLPPYLYLDITDGDANLVAKYDTHCSSLVLDTLKVVHHHNVSFQVSDDVGGSLKGKTTQWVLNRNGCSVVTAVPEKGWTFVAWTHGGVTYAKEPPLTVSAVSSDMDLTAVFKQIRYTIAATAGDGGSIDPSGDSNFDQGVHQTYTITPEEGYEVSDVVVDGISIGPVPKYAFTKISNDHTLEVTFKTASGGWGCSMDGASGRANLILLALVMVAVGVGARRRRRV